MKETPMKFLSFFKSDLYFEIALFKLIFSFCNLSILALYILLSCINLTKILSNLLYSFSFSDNLISNFLMTDLHSLMSSSPLISE